MKLVVHRASAGLHWAKSGVRTFWRRPLAMMGLFFILMAMMSVLGMVPVIGSALALAIMPAGTVGLMAATQEAERGNFPMPHLLFSAFRAEPQRVKQVAALGGAYAAGFLLVLGLSSLIDGGAFARLYLMGGTIDRDILGNASFEIAVLFSAVLFVPLSMLFWHAPALVIWHGVSAGKSLFFSMITCWRNLSAYLLYGAVWVGGFIAVGMLIAVFTVAMGSPEMMPLVMFPATMLMAAMFFTSIFFSYRDCFETTIPGPST